MALVGALFFTGLRQSGKCSHQPAPYEMGCRTAGSAPHRATIAAMCRSHRSSY
jgi:hypothetical protein